MDNMHSFWQLGDELRGHSKASEDHKWLMVASKLAEQRSKEERFNKLYLSKGLIETRPRDKFGFPEENKFDTLNLSMLNLESKFIENMNKSSLRNGVYNMNVVYQKNNANMLDNMNSNKCSGNVQLNKDPHSNNNNNNVNNNMTYSKRHTTVPESPHTNVTSTRRKQKKKFFLSVNIENQSSTTSSSMQFLILEQV